MASNGSVLKFFGGILLVIVIIYAYKYHASSKEKMIVEVRENNNQLSTKKTMKYKSKLLHKKIKKLKQRKKQLQGALESIQNDDKKVNRRVQPTKKFIRKTKAPDKSLSKKRIKQQKPTKQKTIVIGEEERNKMLQNYFKDQKKKVILSYTKVFGDKHWYDVNRAAPFVEKDGSLCKIRHCQVKYNRNLITTADAVLFHAPELPPVNELTSLKIPMKQIWIWMTSESPYFYRNTKISFKEYHHVFNWTGTYRTDSEVWTPFYVIKPLKQSDSKPDINRNFAQGKSKMIIAIISNNCQSYRIDFIKKLKKHIDVDLYGNCKSEVNPDLPKCTFHSNECEELQSQYKFTLSLENSYCTDYVTEKFYINALKRGNVPIILNRGNMSNPKVAPPKSYINILDFKDMESLAKYLKEVASDNTKYNEFHAWRRDYKVGTKNRMCTTCEQLWKREFQRNKKHESAKVEEFWDYKNNCISYDNQMFQKYLQ